jgi:ABC-type branched-subunit amino acid transport system permease subunit
MRAVRESPAAAEALGCDVANVRMKAFVLGGAIAAISGAILVEYIGARAPRPPSARPGRPALG